MVRSIQSSATSPQNLTAELANNFHVPDKNGRGSSPPWVLLMKKDKGQGLVEYSMIIAVIVIVVFVVVALLGNILQDKWYAVINEGLAL